MEKKTINWWLELLRIGVAALSGILGGASVC